MPLLFYDNTDNNIVSLIVKHDNFWQLIVPVKGEHFEECSISRLF